MDSRIGVSEITIWNSSLIPTDNLNGILGGTYLDLTTKLRLTEFLE